jgi:hypothetical protein
MTVHVSQEQQQRLSERPKQSELLLPLLSARMNSVNLLSLNLLLRP